MCEKVVIRVNHGLNFHEQLFPGAHSVCLPDPGHSELVKEFTLPMRCFPATLAILKEVVQECEAYLFL